MRYTFVDSQLGDVMIAGTEDGLKTISFQAGSPARTPDPDWVRDDAFLAPASEQLRAYLGGQRQRFDLRVAPDGTPFQKRVWEAVSTVPFGETRTYRQIAEQIRAPNAVRAVGHANGRNPLPILVPCHRIIGADGGLRGYYGGVHIKEQLLALEGAILPAGRA